MGRTLSSATTVSGIARAPTGDAPTGGVERAGRPAMGPR
jgi:hypothetical protein